MKKILFFISFLYSCADFKPPEKPILGAENLIFISATDFSTGFLSAMSVDGQDFYRDILPIHSDAILRRFEKDIFVINRLGKDSVVRLISTANYLPLYELKFEAKSNPQDFVFVDSQKALVSFHNKNDLIIMDYQNGKILDKINLSHFSDSDGFAEVAGMYFHHSGFVYVAIQRLNRYGSGIWPPSGESYLVKINPQTKEIVNTFVLPFANPISLRYHAFRNSLFISAPAYFGANYALDGGVVEFHLDSETFSTFLTESQVGEEITDCILFNNDLGFLLTQDNFFITKIKVFNTRTKVILGDLVISQSMTGFFSAMELIQDKLYVADRNYLKPKVRIFSIFTFEELMANYEGLPPFSLLYLP